MLQILFLYPPAPELRDYLERELAEAAAVELHFAASDHPLADPALLELAATADVLIGSRPTADFLAQCLRARLFQLPWAGVAPLLPALRAGNALRAERGVPPILLANNHGVCPATAQHAVALLLALTNQLVSHHQWMREGRWRIGDGEARSLPLREDVTVGLLGYGAINARVRELLTPYGVRLAALKRGWNAAECAAASGMATFTPPQLAEFLRATDILIIAVPHTPETEGMLGAAELKLLGTASRERDSSEAHLRGEATLPALSSQANAKSASEDTHSGQEPLGGLPLLVNVARGAVVDEAALYAGLRDRTLAGAALDVWYDYQPEPDAAGRKYPWRDPVAHPFHELPNVLLSPHRAASPLDDLRRWNPVIASLRDMAQGGAPHSIVDLAAGY